MRKSVRRTTTFLSVSPLAAPQTHLNSATAARQCATSSSIAKTGIPASPAKSTHRSKIRSLRSTNHGLVDPFRRSPTARNRSPIESISKADNCIDKLIVVIYAKTAISVTATALALELVSRPHPCKRTRSPQSSSFCQQAPCRRALGRSKNNPGMDPRHPSTPPLSTDRQAQVVVGGHPQNDHRQVFKRRQAQHGRPP